MLARASGTMRRASRTKRTRDTRCMCCAARGSCGFSVAVAGERVRIIGCVVAERRSTPSLRARAWGRRFRTSRTLAARGCARHRVRLGGGNDLHTANARVRGSEPRRRSVRFFDFLDTATRARREVLRGDSPKVPGSTRAHVGQCRDAVGRRWTSPRAGEGVELPRSQAALPVIGRGCVRGEVLRGERSTSTGDRLPCGRGRALWSASRRGPP